jgi:uncharacterized protein YyaL (SSP411 family)
MEAVQGMTGHGGWPLNVFLTPEQLPFYGGTYYPPEPRHGMPAWTQVLQAIAETWRENSEEIRQGGERLRSRLSGGAGLAPSELPITERAMDGAVEALRQTFDSVNGGFGPAPKFPQASVIEFLLLRGADDIALATLRAMASGGIHDQLGGGFARYSVDATWTVPHFEKMLYDNALLARAFLHGWKASGDGALLEACLGTLGWALREMRGPEGGFYSALDADSEGVEGRFYVWTEQQLREILGEDAATAIAWLGVTAEGNFLDPHHPEPGLNVLSARGPEPDAQTRRRIRMRLLQARARRVRPGLDDKRLTAWNALMIAALAEAGSELGETRPEGLDGPSGAELLEAATSCAQFLLSGMRDERGRLLRTYNDGRAKITAYLEDHAYLLEALIVLFETTCEERWFAAAMELADEMIARFADEQGGGFFTTATDGEQLIARRKDLEDSPTPAGSSSAAAGQPRI